MKTSKIIIGALAVVVGLPVAAVGAVYAFVNPNDYRAQIAEALSKKLGREVKLDGDIKLGLSWSNGIDLSVHNVSVANPPWASRPLFAKVSDLGLGVGLQPLLQKKLEISEFKLSGADIMLETNAQGQNNYTFKAEGAMPDAKTGKPETTAEAKPGQPPVAIHIDKVTIADSSLQMRDKAGKVNSFTVKSMSMTNKSDGMKLSFSGEVMGVPVKLELTGGALEQIMGAKWPFKADVDYAQYNIEAAGSLENAGKGVTLSSYTLSAGQTKVAGEMTIKLGGPRIAVDGTVTSGRLDIADLMPQPAKGGGEAAAPVTAPVAKNTNGKMFSTEPLSLVALKTADAKIDVSVDELPLPSATLRQIRTKVDLANGKLTLSPLTLSYAGSTMAGNLTLDASGSPAQLRLGMKAPGLDLAELAKGMITGKADMDISVNTLGNSVHDFASNSDGAVNFVSNGGSIPTSTLVTVGGNLLSALASGAGSSKINCLATRFNIKQGQMQSNGVLFDLDQGTLMADGSINLRDENLNLLLKTRSKVAKISAYIPAIRVTGPLNAPMPTPDTSSTVQKVAGLLMGGDARNAINDGGVPDVVAVAGQNACVYAIEHPQAAKAAVAPTPSPANTLQDVTSGKVKLKDAGGALLKGLFGK